MNIEERNQIVMEKYSRLYKRELRDQIIVVFSGMEGFDNTTDVEHLENPENREDIKKDFDPIYNYPETIFELWKKNTIEKSASQREKRNSLRDHMLLIPQVVPDFAFNCGIMGAILGAKLKAFSINHKRQTHTYTYCEPLVKEWQQVDNLVFNEKNEWVRKVCDCLEYFVKAECKYEFAIRPFQAVEAGNFVAMMRGDTQAFYDFIDSPPELENLLEIGYKANARFFEIRRDIVKKHNELVLKNKEFNELTFCLPWLDSDTEAVCGPDISERYCLRYKEKMIDHFGGGMMYIHTLGLHLIPLMARIKNLTSMVIHDDPKCPRAFDRLLDIKKATGDIPFQIRCKLKEFVDALKSKKLPGGVRYSVSARGASIDSLNELMKEIENYRSP